MGKANYSLSDKIRQQMAQDEPAVKAALCKIANANFATANDPPMGIGKFEGGIKVNKKEIAIKGNFVAEDWARLPETIPEELATVAAIKEIADLIKKRGIQAVRDKYGECHYGDPLRCLTGLG